MDVNASNTTQGRQLDAAPPRPPRQQQSLMSMAVGSPEDEGASLDMSSPAVQAMMATGEARNALLKLSTMLPTLATGIQQFIQGLEAVVPQLVADLVSGNPAGMGGAGMGAPQAAAQPTAPPVQMGMP